MPGFDAGIAALTAVIRRVMGAHVGRVVQWDNAGAYNCEVVHVPYCGCVPGASQVIIRADIL